jgi:integrase
MTGPRGLLQGEGSTILPAFGLDPSDFMHCHTLGHSFAAPLLEGGYDTRTVQKLVGHKEVKTTMIYSDVLNRGGRGVGSPVDNL